MIRQLQQMRLLVDLGAARRSCPVAARKDDAPAASQAATVKVAGFGR